MNILDIDDIFKTWLLILEIIHFVFEAVDGDPLHDDFKDDTIVQTL